MPASMPDYIFIIRCPYFLKNETIMKKRTNNARCWSGVIKAELLEARWVKRLRRHSDRSYYVTTGIPTVHDIPVIPSLPSRSQLVARALNILSAVVVGEIVLFASGTHLGHYALINASRMIIVGTNNVQWSAPWLFTQYQTQCYLSILFKLVQETASGFNASLKGTCHCSTIKTIYLSTGPNNPRLEWMIFTYHL